MSTGPEVTGASPSGPHDATRAGALGRLGGRLLALGRKKRVRAAGALGPPVAPRARRDGLGLPERAPRERLGERLSGSEARRARRRTSVAERQRLLAALRRNVPRGTYIVIDQTHNRLRLMRGDETLLDAPCSAGSGMVLKEGTGGRVWVFDTPRGRFEVLSKAERPVWRRPDWAFVEEGEPIPKNPGDRLEYGSLGEYALYFGNGYMIHGTLYERLLGRPVSHGCIRLGKEPLREVFRHSPLGTPVYIY